MSDTLNDSPQKKSDAELALKIVDRAHQEITWVRSAYKFVATLVALLVATGLYFSYKSFQDLKNDLRLDGTRVEDQLKGQVTTLGTSLKQEFQTEVTKVRQEVASRIDLAGC